ncbi:MAG: hypothetical protein R3A11_01905 [Bdellovibrionota bacterium]
MYLGSWFAGLILLMVGSSSVLLAETKIYLQAKQVNTVMAYREANVSSRRLLTLDPQNTFEVVSYDAQWIKIKIPYNEGSYLMGFISRAQSADITLVKKNVEDFVPSYDMKEKLGNPSKPAKTQAAPQESEEEKPNKEKQNKESSYEFDDSSFYVRGGGGYALGLYQYGADQIRIDSGAYKTLREGQFAAGLTGSFSFLDIFKTFQLGAEFNARFFQFSILTVGARARVSYEYLFGNSKSFWGINAALSPFLEIPIQDALSIEVDPFYLEAMVHRSNDLIPFNLRGTPMLSIRRSF